MLKLKTIFIKTLVPILLMLLLIISTYTWFINGYILSSMQENILDMYEEQTIGVKNLTETQLLDGFTALNNGSDILIDEIQEYVAQRDAELSEIEKDHRLNQDILMHTTDILIDLLKSSGASEIFLILDGQGSVENEHILPGVYIRNNEPKRYAASNSNLLFERGVPAISKKWKLPLDSYWQSGFLFEEEAGNEYFFAPLNIAKQQKSTDFKKFAYWHYGKILDENDLGVLSYSIPLVAKDGMVIGVVGIGVNESHLLKNALHKDQSTNSTRAYMIAKTTDGIHYQPYIIKGKSFSKATILNQTLTVDGKKSNNVYFLNIDAPNEVQVCLSHQALSLYNQNAEFGTEKWSLLSIQNEKELLNRYYTVQSMLNTMLIFSTVICFLGVLWVSRFVSEPIRDMVRNLRKSDPYQEINLQKSGVKELDELANTFTNLSSKVAEAHSRISTIIQMSDAGISAFEYIAADKVVFCSPGFYEMLGITKVGAYNKYADAAYFEANMAEILITEKDADEKIIPVIINKDEKRWVRINQRREVSSILGVLSDVTEDILEKERIEYERDHDLLTGLLNRRAFEEAVSHLLKDKAAPKKAALLVWDLDNLKYINDNYGHTVGDDYLSTFADCIKSFNGEKILSSRRSGDEFVTFVYGFDAEQQIEEILAPLMEKIEKAHILLPNNAQHKISVSVGKAWYPRDSENLERLFEYADFAMYLAKNTKKRREIQRI